MDVSHVENACQAIKSSTFYNHSHHEFASNGDKDDEGEERRRWKRRSGGDGTWETIVKFNENWRNLFWIQRDKSSTGMSACDVPHEFAAQNFYRNKIFCRLCHKKLLQKKTKNSNILFKSFLKLLYLMFQKLLKLPFLPCKASYFCFKSLNISSLVRIFDQVVNINASLLLKTRIFSKNQVLPLLKF